MEAIKKAVLDFVSGIDTREDKTYAPSAPQFAQRCRLWHDALHPLALQSPAHGITKINYGGRDIDTSRMTNAELDRVLTSSGRDIPQQQIGRTVVPRIRGF